MMSTRPASQFARLQRAVEAYREALDADKASLALAAYLKRHAVKAPSEKAFLARAVRAAFRWSLLVRVAVKGVRERIRIKGDIAPVCDVLFALLIEGLIEESAAEAAFVAGTGLPGRIFQTLSSAVQARLRRGANAEATPKSIARTTAMPEWLVDDLARERGVAETKAICEALNEEPAMVLRANTAQTAVEALVERLREMGANARPGLFAPEAIVVVGDVDLYALDEFRRGAFEVQDEGSQIVSHLVDARPGRRVLDACAGAGGKSLHLGALMRGRGELYCLDTNSRKLTSLQQRVRRSGLQNVRVVADPDKVGQFLGDAAASFDRVLVDAPCSGTGTLRRKPDLKRRLRQTDVDELVAKQEAILDRFAPMVKPGGRLVYVTCSVLERENEGQVGRFLERWPQFAAIPVGEIVERSALVDKGFAGDGDYLRLGPHRTGTDGFFVAILERAAETRPASGAAAATG